MILKIVTIVMLANYSYFHILSKKQNRSLYTPGTTCSISCSEDERKCQDESEVIYKTCTSEAKKGFNKCKQKYPSGEGANICNEAISNAREICYKNKEIKSDKCYSVKKQCDGTCG